MTRERLVDLVERLGLHLDEREFDIFQDARSGAALWRAYQDIADHWRNFAMKRIAKHSDIYPVFRELFAPKKLERAG